MAIWIVSIVLGLIGLLLIFYAFKQSVWKFFVFGLIMLLIGIFMVVYIPKQHNSEKTKTKKEKKVEDNVQIKEGVPSDESDVNIVEHEVADDSTATEFSEPGLLFADEITLGYVKPDDMENPDESDNGVNADNSTNRVDFSILNAESIIGNSAIYLKDFVLLSTFETNDKKIIGVFREAEDIRQYNKTDETSPIDAEFQDTFVFIDITDYKTDLEGQIIDLHAKKDTYSLMEIPAEFNNTSYDATFLFKSSDSQIEIKGKFK